MKCFWLALGLLLCGVGGTVGQGVSLPIVLQPVTSTVPSIDLDFLASTTALPPGIMFSRASSRSCTDNTGTIVTVTTNNPCIDYNPTGITNYIRNSGGTGAGPTNWATFANGGLSTTVIGNSVRNGMNGVSIRFFGTTNATYAVFAFDNPSTVPLTVGQPWTQSGYWMLDSGSLSGVTAYVDLRISTGIVDAVANITSTMQRFSSTGTTGAGITGVTPAVVFTFANGAALDFTIWYGGNQLEPSSTVGVLVPTTGSVATTFLQRGLSVEAAATNGSFPSNNWLANQTASATVEGVVQNAATAPDGTATAMALIPGSFSGVHQYFSFQQNGTINTTFTFSVYIKPIGTLFPYVRISLENSSYGANTRNVGFNTTTGAIDAQDAGSLPTAVKIANGWWRFSVTATSLGTAGNYIFNIKPYTTSGVSNGTNTGNSADGVYAWGAQTENGYAPTSLVPTTTAIATRAAEVAYLPVTGIRGVNGNAGTLFAQFIYEAPCPATGGCYSRLIELADGNNVNTGLEIGFSNAFASYPTTLSLLGNGYATTPTTISAGSSMRAVVAFTTGQNYAAANADAVQSFVGTAGGILRAATVLNFNQVGHYQSAASLWVQRVTFIPAFMGAAWVTGKANGSIP
jgi:hypothetical protein